MSYQQFKKDIETRKEAIASTYNSVQDCHINSLELIYIHPDLKTVFQRSSPNNPSEVRYIIALLSYNHLWGTYRHSHIELFGFFDAEYNKIPTIPLVDEWEICGIKEHGGLNAWEWVRANLVIRNLPLFIEKEIEIPNNNNGVTDVQTSFTIIWEYIGKDKIPTPVTSIEELQATIEQLQSENQKLKENLSISNGKFEKILAIINDQRNINI